VLAIIVDELQRRAIKEGSHGILVTKNGWAAPPLS
jgi:hypothetical protein